MEREGGSKAGKGEREGKGGGKKGGTEIKKKVKLMEGRQTRRKIKEMGGREKEQDRKGRARNI